MIQGFSFSFFFFLRGKKQKNKLKASSVSSTEPVLKTERRRVYCVPDSCVIERIRCGELMLKMFRKGCCSVTFQWNDPLTVNDS